MYDYVFVTHLPCFYKVNLYRELAKELKIFVIFISDSTIEKRSDDFIDLNSLNFDYKVINKGHFQSRCILNSIFRIYKVLKNTKFNKIIVSGWDLLEFWFIILFFSKHKNCLALESTVYESHITGLKGLLKKYFLLRISTVFASGSMHHDLLKKLNYQGDVRITKGVGIINKPDIIFHEKIYNKKYLYLGRLTYVKNLKIMIEIFNSLANYEFTIIGDGPQKDILKEMANTNIKFIDSIDNKDLQKYFLKYDILILPSICETWGLVVEESLYYGLPVIISKYCGSSDLIQHCKNGYIVDPYDISLIKETIVNVDEEKYHSLVEGIRKISILDKDLDQINSYQ
ncbi:glycosyltransferase [Oceanispirochaeta sp. M1]|uniref:glycosyltransferase n=1 Tax=Oceanispirochaeta sp. M1 TaxID=2283433 RepID=UPI000E099F22|nr:glycosyltransferase [Oceanispirochaeta sp. M1]NPD74314.1 glycosyltransferase family 4 protein [Oceanispirochaeta sp. M1]RDG29795.1 glycosyltransferase [Oceanispirochaeta sp. M1]